MRKRGSVSRRASAIGREADNGMIRPQRKLISVMLQISDLSPTLRDVSNAP
jgi:hypothetical protein